MVIVSTPMDLTDVVVTVVTKLISRIQNALMWMSAKRVPLPVSLVVSTRWAAIPVPVRRGMS